MQNLISVEVLRAAAEFVVVLDHHRFGALVCLALVLVVALVIALVVAIQML
jgi:hypothetical protein